MGETSCKVPLAFEYIEKVETDESALVKKERQSSVSEGESPSSWRFSGEQFST
jgi:hypothetical protein